MKKTVLIKFFGCIIVTLTVIALASIQILAHCYGDDREDEQWDDDDDKMYTEITSYKKEDSETPD